MKAAVLFLFVLSFTKVFAGPMVNIDSYEQLSAYIQTNNYNGVVLVAKDSKILMHEAYGYKNLESKIPLSVSDKFQIGSVSKQFVAASLLKLQEEKLISLSDPITKYLPELTIYKGITIKDILNHTSGISNYTDHEEFWKDVTYEKLLTLDDIIKFNQQYPLDFENRTKWSYSNTGYVIAGKIVEIVTGMSWDKYISDNFLIPMNMKDTGYEPFFEKVSDVSGHIESNGKMEAFTGYNLSWALSAGGLHSTAIDLFKWTSIYDDSKLLSESSKQEMQQPFLKNYGLGVFNQKYRDDIMIRHDGRTVGFGTNVEYLKKSKLKIVVLDNLDGKSFDVSSLLMAYFYEGKTSALKLKPIPIETEALNEFVGEFTSKELNVKIFLSNNQLYLQPTGQRPYLLKANDKDSFVLEGFAGEEFLRDSNGAITALKHYQGGGISMFSKVK